MVKVAINGFGRIGRLVFKAGYNDPKVDFVAINDLTDAKTLSMLLKRDSVHGKFPGEVGCTDDSITVDGKKIKVYAERDPENLPWKELGVDIVLECTGFFLSRELAGKHLKAGAKKVLLSAPPKGDDIRPIVRGVNCITISGEDDILSNASCTTNCLAPIAKVLNEKFGIVRGLMTTVHAYTNDQKILDLPHKDMRRSRAAAMSMIPTTTGAAIAVGKVIPELNGKLDGMAMRVPVCDGSIVDLTCELGKDVTAEEVNAAIKNAAENELKGIVEYTDEPLVSVDIIGNPHTSIFDSSLTKVMDGKFLKILSWYDNEWGFSNKMLETMKLWAER